MKIISNEKTIKRNSKIGTYTSVASLVILVGGMVISFLYTNQIYLSFLALLIGFILSQVGIYFGNRWGRHPRIDERLTTSLKGLTKDYSLYHYLSPVNHLLVGPAGIWILESYYQRGTIVYEKGKWHQKGGGFFLSYLKIFAQEGLGRPDLETQADLDNLYKFVSDKLGNEEKIPEINAILVFTNDQAILETEGSPIPAIKIDQLKEFIRTIGKKTSLPANEIKKINDLFPQESIT